jgi:hypothetical protein
MPMPPKWQVWPMILMAVRTRAAQRGFRSLTEVGPELPGVASPGGALEHVVGSMS